MIKQDTPRLLKARSDAPVARIAKAGETLVFVRWLNGLDDKNYFQVPPEQGSQDWNQHYVDADHCDKPA
ncbi:hypothetical protein [Neorhizobium sp. T7_12]|uniref:hypothetical protein n=1 Tax=Neorhizobium sp. T7_12 TaxID=2093832 RepID=UPI00155F0834|nr:hypothetical protein [Neorhizobium sp. T7_12]